MDTRTALVAIFKDRAAADAAVQQLIANGFNSNQIDVNATDELARNAASGNAALTGTHHDTSGGGISGFFHRLFGSDADEDDRTYYSDALRRGQTAVAVHTDDEDDADRAADILNNCGAIDVQNRDEARLEGRSRETLEGNSGRRDAIPVVREEMQVGKRAVQRGGVRIHSHITEQPAEEEVRLREERVKVDRRPADRPATEADLAAADSGVIEVVETVEEPVVSKTARVVEEVFIGKEVNERSEKVRDNLRRSDVKVEDARSGRATTADRGRTGTVSDLDTDFQNDFRTRYGTQRSLRYEDYAPAYRYGYDMASDPRYQGRRFADVEQDLRTDYSRRYPNSAWERTKEAVQHGWDKVTGKA